MKEPNNSRNVPLVAVASVSALILTVGGGISWWTASRQTPTSSQSLVSPAPKTSADLPIQIIPSDPPETPPKPIPETTPPASPPLTPTPESAVGQQTVDVYWLQEKEGQMELAARPLPLETKDNPNETLEVAFNYLLTPPNSNKQAEKQFSEIPSNTQLLSLKMAGDDVYLDLSSEFVQGGGSTSMISRLGQVIYTATSLNPEAKVWISVEGEPLKVLGGEG
ncbi:MAG: GerMN domain-containing protein, partial [Microcoleaceae cyanobacterium]